MATQTPKLSAAKTRQRENQMDRVFVASLVAGVTLALAAAAPRAQEQRPKYPIFTADHLDESMKTVGLAFTLTRSSIDKNNPENAKDYLIRARDQLAITITFWRDRKNDEAIATLRETLKKMDALDAAMSADTADMKAAAALAASVASSCESCHAKYREQDPVTKGYRVKSGI
jgi:hypothetical protein